MDFIRTILCFVLLLLSPSTLWAESVEVIVGAGPSTRVVKIFFQHLSKHEATQGYRFIIPSQSAKHQGGIINADNFMFGRTGRPLATYEQSLGKREILLAKVPITFAMGKDVPKVILNLEDIRRIFQREITNWKTFGGPDATIELVGRERNESIFTILKNEYPFFKQVIFDRVFHRDTEVVDFLKSASGKHSISFGAEPNFQTTNRIEVSDFNSGIAVGLVYDVINDNHPVVLAAKEYAASVEWQKQLRKSQLLPVGP